MTIFDLIISWHPFWWSFILQSWWRYSSEQPLHIFQPLYKIICVMDSLYRNQVFLWEMTSILVHFTMICKNLIKCHVQTTLQLSNELFAGKFYRMIWSIWNIFPKMIIPGFTSKKGKSKSKFYIEIVNLEGRVLPFR